MHTRGIALCVGCGFPQWQGDGYCDDVNNDADCEFDGGDCCGDDVNTNYCTACECLEPNEQPTTTTSDRKFLQFHNFQ